MKNLNNLNIILTFGIGFFTIPDSSAMNFFEREKPIFEKEYSKIENINKDDAKLLVIPAIEFKSTGILSDIVRFYKTNKIDINKPINAEIRYVVAQYDLLGLAIMYRDTQGAELLLNNGAKIKDKYIIAGVPKPVLIMNKSMAELLIPRGADVPKINSVLSSYIASFNQRMPTFSDPEENGVGYIKYLVENGSSFNINDLNTIDNTINIIVNNPTYIKRNGDKFFKDIKKYLQEKLDKRNK